MARLSIRLFLSFPYFIDQNCPISADVEHSRGRFASKANLKAPEDPIVVTDSLEWSPIAGLVINYARGYGEPVTHVIVNLDSFECTAFTVEFGNDGKCRQLESVVPEISCQAKCPL